MKKEIVHLLQCPKSGQNLKLIIDREIGQEVITGTLVSDDRHFHYPICGGIPRFVPESNYADTFGMQWNHFRKTQLDSYSGQSISGTRFWETTGWTQNELKNKWVLDVGCGSGRFTEIALQTGANVVALDYSSAVDACYLNLSKRYPNLTVIQADIYHLPLQKFFFDFVYCLGVIQHTPDVKLSFISLTNHIKEGGRISVDVYPKLWRNYFWIKYWLRPFTKDVPPKNLLNIVENLVKYLLPFSKYLNQMPLGRFAKYLLPITTYYGVYSLDEKQHFEWSMLDTFDMLSPEYDQPQTLKTFRSWFDESGFQQIKIFRKGFYIGQGIKTEGPNK
jgi:SAM-dependent methyltransferase